MLGGAPGCATSGQTRDLGDEQRRESTGRVEAQTTENRLQRLELRSLLGIRRILDGLVDRGEQRVRRLLITCGIGTGSPQALLGDAHDGEDLQARIAVRRSG